MTPVQPLVKVTSQADIRFDGAPAFRDFGGHHCGDGRAVKRGVLYRSEALHRLTEGDMAIADALGLALLCDLRSGAERARAPSRWPDRPGLWRMNLDIDADFRADNAPLHRLLEADPSPYGARQVMIRTYQQLPAALAPKLPALWERLASGSGLPMLVHCTAGKDRTGFVCALILHAIGVPAAAVFMDYLRTNEFFDRERRRADLMAALGERLGRVPEAELVDAMVGVRSEYLEAAFAMIVVEHGSVDRYLAEACGLTSQARSRMQACLLE